MHNVNHGTCYS